MAWTVTEVITERNTVKFSDCLAHDESIYHPVIKSCSSVVHNSSYTSCMYGADDIFKEAFKAVSPGLITHARQSFMCINTFILRLFLQHVIYKSLFLLLKDNGPQHNVS